VCGLRKEYGRKVALHDLTLMVQPGEVFGFLGPNGAGKTTTIKILTGLVSATAGEARIFGRSVTDRQARERVGYLPQHFRFHDWMTGAGLLDFHGRLADLPAAQRRAQSRLVEGATIQGWKQALGALALHYPDRIGPYIN